MLAVKSSVSIVLTGGFADLSVTVYVTMEQFLTAFVLVIPFYFGARTEKRMKWIQSQQTGRQSRQT